MVYTILWLCKHMNVYIHVELTQTYERVPLIQYNFVYQKPESYAGGNVKGYLGMGGEPLA